MKTTSTLIAAILAVTLHGAATAREFQPATGRYIQADPIGLQGGPNRYVYGDANPQSEVDPDGRNPAAVIRAATLGYRAGEAISPYAQPFIARTLDAMFLPDYNDPNVVMAQNNKQVRKRIDGLQTQISEHNKKLNQEPDCPASDHWRNEIKVWQSEIDRLRLRLPNGK